VNTDVAAFARQLRQDGVDAAKADAERILAEARSEADEIKKQGLEAAAVARAEAQAGIESARQRFAAEIGMAARDAMLQTRQEIERVVMRLLQAKISGALATDEVVRTAIVELIRNPPAGGAWEIGVGPRIGKALVEAAVSDVFKGREAAVAVMEEFGGAGLEFRTVGGSEVLELSEESVAEAFRRMLSPELNRLIDSLPG
jgi:V/A-type H+-transporting ATPase subunit E